MTDHTNFFLWLNTNAYGNETEVGISAFRPLSETILQKCNPRNLNFSG